MGVKWCSWIFSCLCILEKLVCSFPFINGFKYLGQYLMYFEQYLFWTVSKQMRSQGCPKGFLVVVQGV